jgi:hypothetical protein
MKPLLVSMIVAAVALAVSSRSIAQEHAVALPGTTTDRASVSANNQNATGANATPKSGDSSTEDDTLYRGKTSDMQTTLIRDEGALHFKPRAKERIHEVDTLKDLQTSGSDPKFQGSLLHNGLTSIEDVGAKPVERAETQQSGAPRTRRHQVFPVPNDSPKAESDQAKADSSPSPSPSATASPTPSR